LLLLASCAGFVQASLIYSESFSLVESASVTRSVFANEGDRIVGNFSVSNIPTWTDAIKGNSETVQYAFKVSKIEGSEKCPTDIVLYEVDQTEHASFDVYCEYSGYYRLRFNVGMGAPALGIGRMRATLNYDVIKNSSEQLANISLPTPTLTPLPKSNVAISPSPSIPETHSLTIPFLFVVIILLAGFTFKKNRRGLVQNP
jgi:hypothetical protein